MRKEEKAVIIDRITETLKEYACFYLVEPNGLDAEKTSALRRAANKAEVKMMVVKNTLLHKALEGMEGDFSELYGSLKGATTLMCAQVGNAPAKLIKDFVKGDATLPALKAAYVEETVYVGADQLDTLCAIKSKSELIADVVALLQSPAKNVISGLQGAAGNKIHGLLETLSKKEG